MTSALPACMSMTQCVCVFGRTCAGMCSFAHIYCPSVGVGFCTFTRDHVLVCAFPLQ